MHKLDLSGTWEIQLDPKDLGIQEDWSTKSLENYAKLPGSLDENGIGTPNEDRTSLAGLSRKVSYTGAAWFSREIHLPQELVGKDCLLTLERVHWTSHVWVNGKFLGYRDSLSTAHQYYLPSQLASSKVRITLRIDNRIHVPIGRIGHAVTDWTQTNWNGVVGEISLTPLSLSEDSRVALEGREFLFIGTPNQSLPSIEERAGWTICRSVGQAVTPTQEPWSDVQPNLSSVDDAGIGTGHRSVSVQGKQILVNGQPIFLRGTLECCVFPKTGYPPTDLHSWVIIMQKVKEFGLNHVRFHSWCPPRAAFQAADKVGVYLQVELPVWTGVWPVTSDASLLDFCHREARRILLSYGDHPSFLLFGLGNELAFYGPEPEIESLLDQLRQEFPNQLHNFSAHGTWLSDKCDYYVQADNGKPGSENRPLRGSTWFGVGSRFDRESPGTLTTCNEAADQFDRPVIAHEVAEWAVFPDVHLADQYDGVLEARNFQWIAESLRSRGMLDRAPAFVHASGSLSAELYKEEIETLLRTNGIAGYQLLGLTDFPGQGTATIGMLDAFWQEKGFVDGRRFQCFCAETVPLLSIAKRVWFSDETLTASVLVFHSGPEAHCRVTWRILDDSGSEIATGSMPEQTVGGTVATTFGSISFSLIGVPTPARVRLILETDSGARNDWTLWVYSRTTERNEVDPVRVFDYYRQDVVDALAEGQAVWLRLNPRRMWGGLPGRFAPAFWSPIHFKEQVGTMGTLIQSDHPLYRQFPTSGWSEWHWWDVLMNSKALNLNGLPLTFRPILQVIDRYERNDKLGTIFEALVGKGRLLVTAIDFEAEEDRPSTRQLEASIRSYLSSPEFQPRQVIDATGLASVFSREP